MTELRTRTLIIAEAVVFVALATALSFVKLFSLPQGGSVTAASMIPLLWLSLRRGAKIGIFVCVVYGLIQLMVEPFVVHPVQFLLDYPIAFGALGLAGLFQNRPFIGINIGILGRFLAHFASGVIFFSEWAPEGMSSFAYSAIYNGSYLLPELAISIYLTYLVVETKALKMYM
ncbi:MAG: energy-coupled thiamine transporter ThiT [Candidatus Bathyarchaeota archaeon]|nr:MAG: energy-coupled thiamine transporter ThiT [Candidatus Bathyarchaeota archaeon]